MINSIQIGGYIGLFNQIQINSRVFTKTVQFHYYSSNFNFSLIKFLTLHNTVECKFN